MISISIVNRSTVVSDTEGAAVAAALKTQVTRDFYPLWGIQATVDYVAKGKTPSDKAWHLLILDNSDEAGALGYHDITPTGQPLGKVFAKTDKVYGLSWSVTASHELLELLVDPWCNLTVFNQSSTTKGRIYAYEVCDACEDDQFGYKIDTVLVSDFVTPHWFEGWRTVNSATFDYGKKITAPYQLLKGGYISYFDVTGGGGWQQKMAEMTPNYKSRAPVGSRRERRIVGHDRWIQSVP